MTLEVLQKEMIAAMKEKNKERKDTLSSLVSAVKKLAIDERVREDINEELVDRAILKELKLVREQIETCPKDRCELLNTYKNRESIIEEFAPRMLSKEEILTILREEFAEVIESKNKGAIMKSVMPRLKGKADGKLINECVAEICK